MLELDGKQHWHSRLLGKTDRRKVIAVYLSSRYAPLLPTSRQPEPNKGTASGLVVVREPSLGRVAAGRCLSVGLQVRGGGTPRRLHTAAADGRCRLGWTGGGSSVPCRLVAMSTTNVGRPTPLAKATNPGARKAFGRTSGRKTAKQSKRLQPKDQDPSKNLWTDRQTDLAQLKMGWIQTTPNWSYKPV